MRSSPGNPSPARVAGIAMLHLALVLAAAPALASPTSSDPSAPALSPGRYGLRMTFVTEADAPIVGKVTTSTTSTALVDVSERDGKLIAAQRTCGMTTDGGLFTLKASPAFLKALPPTEYEMVVEDGVLRADMGVAAVAVDKDRKSLPKSRKDKAFTDPDKDGRKGVPLEVSVGSMTMQIDVATLGKAILVGPVSDGGVEGRPDVVFSEEKILGGIPEMLAGGSKTVVEDKSSFTLAALGPDATCAAVNRMSQLARASAPGAALAQPGNDSGGLQRALRGL